MGLHVASPQQLVEIVDEAGKPCPPGVVGHVLVTPLSNLAMPLLAIALAIWPPGRQSPALAAQLAAA